VTHNPPGARLLRAEDTRIATNIRGKSTKRIVRTLTTESAGRNRLKCEKELLNSRKNSHFPKRIISASPHRSAGPHHSQKQMANPRNESCVILRVECAGGNKRNHPASPMLFPPMTRSEGWVSRDTDSRQKPICKLLCSAVYYLY
jgi:hypothetical protein